MHRSLRTHSVSAPRTAGAGQLAELPADWSGSLQNIVKILDSSVAMAALEVVRFVESVTFVS